MREQVRAGAARRREDASSRSSPGAGPGGRTVLPVVRASGQLAVRRTGPATVHLVATAFGPLGGDDAEIRLVVEEGAQLTRALGGRGRRAARPGRSPPSSASGSTRRWPARSTSRLEPTVVAARAPPPGRAARASSDPTPARSPPPSRCCWAGPARSRAAGPAPPAIERAGRPLLHTTVGLGPGEPAWLPPVAPRAYASTVHIGDRDGRGRDRARTPSGCRCPAAG